MSWNFSDRLHWGDIWTIYWGFLVMDLSALCFDNQPVPKKVLLSQESSCEVTEDSEEGKQRQICLSCPGLPQKGAAGDIGTTPPILLWESIW